MTDFVLEQAKEGFNNGEYPTFNFRDLVYSYGNFLKQGRELWMFTPCDEFNNVLEKPEGYDQWYFNILSYPECTSGFEENRKYQKAKERVLFENCTTKKIHFAGTGETFYEVYYKDNLIWVSWNKSKTVESLLDHPHEFELTETAEKLIGL